jgi:hypothetical protein
MGCLVVAHATKTMPDALQLASLPSSIGWAVYHDAEADAFFIDTFRSGRNRDWPFTSMPPSKELPLDFVQGLEPLAAIYKAIQDAGLANSFNRAFLNLNLALSKSLQMPVCSFCSDDDGLDFACVSDDGRLTRLRCECGDLHVAFEQGEVAIQPLLIEDDVGDSADLSYLHDPTKGIRFLERKLEQSSDLHAISAAEVMAFLRLDKPPLGLTSFDGMESPPTKIAESTASLPIESKPKEPIPAAQSPWWKFW